ncbi:hypothetical protein J6590_005510 [Homalodisca vitripennis]|nr:hypothetical protein J6590_005510 [Homalodisca vitripennis]
MSGAAIALTVVCAPFVSPALRRVCLPYVPATSTQIDNVLHALKGRKGNLLDLGSGDGRIVLAAASAGFKSTGVELNPWLVWYSRFAALKAGFHQKTSFYRSDLWKFSLKPYNNIVIFGVQQMMEELEEKMTREVSEDTYVVACRFPLAHRNPDATIGTGLDTVWLYKFNR